MSHEPPIRVPLLKADRHALGGHDRIAAALEGLVLNEGDGKAVAVVDGWGSGKFTVVRLFMVLGLLICLACATPFPFENLEEGMTVATAREKFGAPESSSRGYRRASPLTPKPEQVISAPPGVTTFSTWIYYHEKLEPWPRAAGRPLEPPLLPMPLRIALTSLVGVPLFFVCRFPELGGRPVPLAWVNWTCWYVCREPVALHFEAEKLVRWETLPSVRFGAAGSSSWEDDLHQDD